MASAHEADDTAMRVGDLEVRPGEGLATAAGQAIVLSVREFGLLVALVSRAGHVVSREELYRGVWGGDLRHGDRSVDVYVHKLRVKLEAALPGLRSIHTHVGFGYRLDFEPTPGATTSDTTSDGSSHDFHKESTGQ